MQTHKASNASPAEMWIELGKLGLTQEERKESAKAVAMTLRPEQMRQEKPIKIDRDNMPQFSEKDREAWK